MKKFPTNYSLLLIAAQIFLLFVVSCNDDIDQPDSSESGELKLMPRAQDTYLLDYRDGKSYVYSVYYDFQGLTGDAVLTPIVSVDGPAHLTITPSTISGITPSLVIVNNGVEDHKVYIVPVTGNSHIDENKYLAPEYGLDISTSEGGSIGKITQVDFDQNNHLFIAGTSGFYEVYYGSKSSPVLQSYAIYNANADQHQLYAKPYAEGVSVMGTLATEESGTIVYNQLNGEVIENPKFSGGDILFTQNSNETSNVESEMLISFTQEGDQAMMVEFDVEGEGLMAYHLFSLRKTKSAYASNSDGWNNNVTGAALMGDNYLMTSHFNSNTFSVWNLKGEELATPTVKFPTSAPDGWVLPADGKLAWGDMASYQVFCYYSSYGYPRYDRVVMGSTFQEMSENITYSDVYWPLYHEKYKEEFTTHKNKSIAFTKIYHPNKSNWLSDVINENDNLAIGLEDRRLSHNASVADLRGNADKFLSLGGEGGYVIMKLKEPFVVQQNTELQVVETSHGCLPEYKDGNGNFDLQLAWNAYPEKAKIYVSASDKEYVGSWLNEEDWIYVGTAGIANNIFHIPDGITQINWIKVEDSGSESYDGFDVNFVAVYNYQEPPVIFERGGITYTEAGFFMGDYYERPRIIPHAYNLWNMVKFFNSDMLALVPKPEGKSRTIGIFDPLFESMYDHNLDGLDGFCIYEVHDDGSFKMIRVDPTNDGGWYSFCFVDLTSSMNDQVIVRSNLDLLVRHHFPDYKDSVFPAYYYFDPDKTMAENDGHLYYTGFYSEYFGYWYD